MKIITDPSYEYHLTGLGHPEKPERMQVVVEALKSCALLRSGNHLTPVAAPLEALLLCHTAEYIETVKRDVAATRSLSMLSTGDVVISPNSYSIACLAVGAGLCAVDAIFTGQTTSVFCCVRPPGHHATSRAGMGFCIFNNAAICARYAIAKYQIERVAIVDWDVHHGNGTQEIFWNDPQVFYFSTHQKGLYPGTGNEDEIGVGNILNCPISPGLGSRKTVLEAFDNKLYPAMKVFQPQLILISAGFDGHLKDPLGGFDLSTEDFSRLTKKVKALAEEFCSSRIISFLEGGYNLSALSASVKAHIESL
jgi:acetoin utilization deacetylase AcuC-like enzyme